MSYLEQIRSSIGSLVDVVNKTGSSTATWSGLGAMALEMLAVIADELHELNKRLENGETVQTGSDQTRT